MRCKTCSYPLWRLRARQCPECGAPFRPSEFEFIRNSVRFGCPFCDQAYYGDDPQGRLWPVEFDCISCGRRVHMDQMVLSPAAGLAEERTEPRRSPWLERRRIGWWRAWVNTVGMALTAPTELIESTPEDSSLLDAAKFWLLTQVMIWAVAAVPLWGVLGAGMLTAVAGRGRIVLGPMAAGLAMIFGAGLVASLAVALVFALIAHGILRLTGRTGLGPRRTMQAVAYSSGANVVSAIPCMGVSVGWIWWLVSATLMMRAGHRVRAWRAVTAVVGPVAVVLMLMVGGYAVLVWWALKQAGPALAASAVMGSGAAPAVQRAGNLAAAMAAWSAAEGPDAPPMVHIAELMADGVVEAGWVAGMPTGPISPGPMVTVTTPGGTVTSPQAPFGPSTRVGPLSLLEFVAARPETRREAARAASRALAAGTASYRFGEFVFTDPRRRVPEQEDPEATAALWVFYSWPESGAPAPRSKVQIGRRDGTAVEVGVEDFPTLLEAQNRLRSGLGLPVLELPGASAATEADPSTEAEPPPEPESPPG